MTAESMFTVILVDDEPIITRGLRELIPWEQLGFTVSGTFENAHDALRYAVSSRPDIVITDLVMSDMSGFDLVSRLREKDIDASVIVLSAYGEFEYARSLFRSGVVEFLLKPVAREDLARALQEAAGRIQDRREQRRRLAELRARVAESLPLLRQKFLMDLTGGRLLDEAAIKVRARQLELDLTSAAFSVAAIQFDEVATDGPFVLEHDRDLIHFVIANVSEDMFQAYKVCHLVAADRIMQFIVAHEPGCNDAARFFAAANRISETLRNHFQITVRIGLSGEQAGVVGIAQAASEADEALKRALGEDRIVHVRSIKPERSNAHSYPMTLERTVINEVILTDSFDARRAAAELYEAFVQSSDGNRETVSSFCLEFSLQLKREVASSLRSPPRLYPAVYTKVRALFGCLTSAEVQDWLMSALLAAHTEIQTARNERLYDAVHNAQCYIAKHLADELSLPHVASRVYMSPSYFGTLFKSRTGENFVDYLSRMRLNRSKELLLDSSLRIQDIAEAVGYRSPSYFSDAFRKYVGVSPTQYRDALQSCDSEGNHAGE